MTSITPDLVISSVQNPRVKHAVRLRQRRHRDAHAETLVEGYRELSRAVEHGHVPHSIFFCPAFFLGENECGLLRDAHSHGAKLWQTSESVFSRLSYRDRPDGLLGVAASVGAALADVPMMDVPFLLVAEAVEKPGNLGTMLRTGDGAGVDGVIVCDRTTDLNNPNVVRASTGTVFRIPVAECSSADAIAHLRAHNVAIVAATPAATALYWQIDYRRPTAIVVGSEQYGLSAAWLDAAEATVRIPMHGQADSLNVAAATTILLYEVVRQRGDCGA